MIYLKGTAKAPGTCGELVEGTIDGRDFLITCPVDIWSEITVETTGEPLQKSIFSKTQQAISLAVSKWNTQPVTFSFSRKSDIPLGKGMGSSTADIAAAVQAVARALGQEATSEEIADLALEIEPSDALMYPGIYLFDHKKGRWREPLGDPLEIDIVVLDPGGEVDTVQFNSNKNLVQLNAKKEPLVQEAANLVKDGLAERDPEKLGRGATISAFANQEILPKPDLDAVLKWAKEVKSLGVNVAHSGTVMGILLHPQAADKDEVAEYIKKKRPDWDIFTTRLIGGGIK
ncbi:MAG: L-threonine kinase [Clostridia bacterium]|jgi:L-threonine kinase|nr:kinase [Clostridiales bacterium]MDK2984868.1 L-threonine kinase [Clostridia bacterium]